MKITILLPDLFDSIGGIQTFNRCFVKALDELSEKHDLKINILVLTDTGNNKSLLNKYLTSKYISYRYFDFNRVAFAWIALMESFDSDLVIFGHVNFSPLTVLMERKVKKFLIVHGTDVWSRLPTFKRVGVSIMNKILSVSKYTANKMIKQNELDESKFFIFPNTLDPFFIPNLENKEKNNLDLPKGNILLTVSRLGADDKTKRIDLIIESLPNIIKEKSNTYLVIVGAGPDKSRLMTLAKELGVSNNTLFKGRVEDSLLPSYYDSCDMFILPSTQEGFGIVFLEAMYFSKPCIGAKAGGITEVIEDGITGLLAEPNDKESLTKCILKLISDEELRKRMGEAGKKRFEREFSFDAFKNRLEKILGELLS
jgi:glycosyltransferase involved in cell wall biosynthesis